MKRLVLLLIGFVLIVSPIGCVSTSEYEALQIQNASLADENANLEIQMTQLQSQLENEQAQMSRLQEDYDKLRQEYIVLQAAQGIREMVFGQGIRIFDVKLIYKSWTWRSDLDDWGKLTGIKGKIQNISSQPMKTIYIMVVNYNQDGSLLKIQSDYFNGLFPQEVAEWQFQLNAQYDFRYVADIGRVSRDIGSILSIYAIGDKY